MTETFYSVLGVSAGADTESIRAAYREQVKEHHPDVSDNPDASEQFKRLTIAKEVLVDVDKRQRYDRLGHSEYVRKHVESPVWTVECEPESRHSSTEPSTQTGGRTERETRRTDTEYDRTAWLGEDGPTDHVRHRRQRRRNRHRRHAAAAGAGSEEWQHASKAYRRADTSVSGQSSLARTVLAGLRSVGPWLLVHLVFIGSAIATAWLALVQAETYVDVSWPTLLGGVLLLAMVVFVSVLHVISQLYS